MSTPLHRDLLFVFALSSTLLLIACREEHPSAPVESPASPDVASVIVNPSAVILIAINERLRLFATARDAHEQQITGRVFRWSSSDEAVVSVTDSGMVTAVSNGLALITVSADGSTGAAVVVVAQIGVQLAFVVPPPTNVYASEVIDPGIEVEIRDALGTVVGNATKPVSVVLGENPRGGTLLGTTTVKAIAGVAAFDDLSIDRAGWGYTLVVSLEGAANETSEPFEVLSGLR